MANSKKPLTLGDIISTQKKGDIQMSEFMRAQIAAKQAEFSKEPEEAQIISKPQKPSVTNKITSDSANVTKLIDAVEKNTKQLSILTDLILKKNTSVVSSATPNIVSKIKPTTITEEKRQLDNTKEQQVEQAAVDDKKVDLLEKIEKNTEGLSSLKNLSKDKPKETTGPNLGLLGTGLAIGLGTIVGIIQAQVKTIKFFFDLAKKLTPDIIAKKISAIYDNTVKLFSSFNDKITSTIKNSITFIETGFNQVTLYFKNVFSKIKGLFSFDSQSNIGKVLTFIKDIITKFVAPFTEAFSELKSLVSGPIGKAVSFIQETFGFIGKYLGAFASKIGVVSKIVSKIFYPITIIMTLWDTVKGAIEGFEKEGIIGGIKGAIKGFFDSLIFAPIDMIKNATAWILGIFGFDKAEKFLKSFSLEKTFNEVIDAIFSPIETIKNIFTKIIDFFKNIEIPAIDLPLIGKMGPWKPFSDSKQESKAEKQTSATTATPSTNQRSSTTRELTKDELISKREALVKRGPRKPGDFISEDIHQKQIEALDAAITGKATATETKTVAKSAEAQPATKATATETKTVAKSAEAQPATKVTPTLAPVQRAPVTSLQKDSKATDVSDASSQLSVEQLKAKREALVKRGPLIPGDSISEMHYQRKLDLYDAAIAGKATATITKTEQTQPLDKASPVQKAPVTSLQPSSNNTLTGGTNDMTLDELKAERAKIVKRGPIGKGPMAEQSYNNRLDLIDAAIAGKATATITRQSGNAQQLTPNIGKAVYDRSMENKTAAMNTSAAPAAPTIVSAPTQVNNSSQNAIIKTPIRNTDSTLMTYLKSRFA
jgi:hypothetical protein